MSMNEEEFASFLWALENTGLAWAVDDLRARDTAQREALARVEAERDTAIAQMQNIRTNRDRLNKQLGDAEFKLCISQQQLTEAVGLIEKSADLAGELGDYLVSLAKRHSGTELLDHERNLRAFLDRHAQAEQQEAQGALAGDLASAVRVLLEVPQLQGEQAFSAQPIIDRVRAALATQPAAGEPVAWSASFASNGYRYDIKGRHQPPPAAAHGDEADRDEAQLQCLRDLYESGYNDGQNNPNGYSSIAEREDAAQHTLRDMRAQAAGGAQHA